MIVRHEMLFREDRSMCNSKKVSDSEKVVGVMCIFIGAATSFFFWFVVSFVKN